LAHGVSCEIGERHGTYPTGTKIRQATS
jgi:hypothetical protein